MGDVVPLEDPGNYVWATKRIRQLWKDGVVEILPHAQKQMRARDLDALDVEHIIKYGRVVEHSLPNDVWRYKVEGTAVDRRKASCVVEVRGHLMIVTVIAARKRTASE